MIHLSFLCEIQKKNPNKPLHYSNLYYTLNLSRQRWFVATVNVPVMQTHNLCVKRVRVGGVCETLRAGGGHYHVVLYLTAGPSQLST